MQPTAGSRRQTINMKRESCWWYTKQDSSFERKKTIRYLISRINNHVNATDLKMLIKYLFHTTNFIIIISSMYSIFCKTGNKIFFNQTAQIFINDKCLLQNINIKREQSIAQNFSKCNHFILF